MQDFTTTGCIAQLKRITHTPTSSGAFLLADFLAVLDFVLQGEVAPLIMSCRENYFLYAHDTAFNASGNYDIPSRAMGNKLADIHYVFADYIEQIGQIELDLLETESNSPILKRSALIVGNTVRVRPKPTAGVIRQYVYLRPGKLVLPSAAGAITAIDTSTKTITVSAVPSGIVVGARVDFVRAMPGFDTLGLDNIVTGISGTDVTFTDALPDSLVLGDYACLAVESPIPQIPVEIFPLLLQGAAVKVYEAQGYMEKFKIAEGKYVKMQDSAMKLLAPRIDQEAKRIIIRNGAFRQRGRFLRRTWFQ